MQYMKKIELTLLTYSFRFLGLLCYYFSFFSILVSLHSKAFGLDVLYSRFFSNVMILRLSKKLKLQEIKKLKIKSI